MNTVKADIVKDAAGGYTIEIEGKRISNMFVKEWDRIKGSVTRVNMEVIYLAKDEKGKNW